MRPHIAFLPLVIVGLELCVLSVIQSTPSGCLLETSTKTMTHGVLLEGFRHVWFAALTTEMSPALSVVWLLAETSSTDPEITIP